MRIARQLGTFAVVGLGGTAAYLLLFLALHGLGAQPASLLARVVVALPTSWANARLTFRSDVPVRRAYAAGLAGLVVGAGLAAATLAVLHAADPHPSHVAEVGWLAAAQLVAAAGRFALLRAVSTGRPVLAEVR